MRVIALKDYASRVGGMKVARSNLKRFGIPADEFLDERILEACEKAPPNTNIGRWPPEFLTLSPTEGVGAMVHLFHQAKLDVVAHIYVGVNHLIVRNEAGQMRHCKCYTSSKGKTFYISGYLREDAPEYYVFVSFNGPRAWAIPRATILEAEEKRTQSQRTAELHPQLNRSLYGGMVFLPNKDSAHALTAKALDLA